MEAAALKARWKRRSSIENPNVRAAEELRFEYAAKLRDEIKELRRELNAVTA